MTLESKLRALVAKVPHDKFCPFSGEMQHLGPTQPGASLQFCVRCQLEALLAERQPAQPSLSAEQVKEAWNNCNSATHTVKICAECAGEPAAEPASGTRGTK